MTDTNSSAQAQRKRILAHLITHGRLTSLYARDTLNCYHPNPRIFSLREDGYGIKTEWETVTDTAGNKHRVGCWVLVSLPPAANDDAEGQS
ncbi:MAG: helix-turn-helix domain-containing protein [bacterium]|jgi:hypothetical protein|nr:helix-turn-helix domain-containing protein [bacterium]